MTLPEIDPRAEMAILSGDPAVASELYVIRFRIFAGIDVAPHWHPEDEHITVIEGAFGIGYGDSFVADTMTMLLPGAYLLVPKGVRHFSRYEAGTVVQVHGKGPLETHYVTW